MEDPTDLLTPVVEMKEEPECMEITPLIDQEDFMDAAATSLLADSSAQNPYADQMLKDGLTYADIDYFLKSYKNINIVKYEKIHCTVCNKHVGTAVDTNERYAHPLLQVVVCENCYVFYCSGDFVTDKDGSELYCRWCGEGGQVFCCSKCPHVFCRKCISRNLGKGMAPEIECMEDWLCFTCNPCQISKQRALCWAINKYAQETKDLSEFSPHLKSLLFIDYSTCCKSKRALAKAGILPAAKKQKKSEVDTIEGKESESKLKKALEKPEEPAEEAPQPTNWENVIDCQDEVICTPDILPFEESPPSSPPPMMPIEYAPPPGQRGLDAPPNVPVVKKLQPILPKPIPKPKPKVTPPVTPKVTIPKTINNVTIKSAPKPVTTTVTNVVPTTQKITVPVQKGNTNSDEQWFGTAVIRSAEVTEYISSKVSTLAFMNSSGEITDEKREEIYRTFQSHLDISIAKLKNIKQNMTSSYKRLLSKQGVSGNTIKIQPMVINPPATTPVQPLPQIKNVRITPVKATPAKSAPAPSPTPTTPVNKSTYVKPTRSTTRKKSISYVESTSEEEWEQSDSDDDYSSGSARRRNRKKKKTTPKKTEPNQVIKHVDITSIVKPKINEKVILDVIDLVDDDSNDGISPVKKTKDNLKSLSDIEREEVPDIDSDISEILPDHLVDDKDDIAILSDVEDDKKKNNYAIEIVDDDNDEKKDNEQDKNNEDLKDKSEDSKINIESKEQSEESEKNNEGSKEKTDEQETKVSKEKSEESKKNIKVSEEELEKDNIDSQEQPEESEENEAIKDEVKENDADVKGEIDEEKISEDGDASLEEKELGKSNLSEEEKGKEESQSSLPTSKNDENDQSIDKIDDDGTNTSEVENDIATDRDINTNTDSMSKSDICEEKTEFHNGKHSTSSPKIQNDLSDNAVDNEMEKSTKEKTNNANDEDYEDLLSGSTIKSKTTKDNYGDEFSKFVTNSKSSIDDALENELVSDICDEADDALSLPPQNTLDFALGFREGNIKGSKGNFGIKNSSLQNEEKSYLDNELNVLRKLAENCVNSDVATAANNPNVC